MNIKEIMKPDYEALNNNFREKAESAVLFIACSTAGEIRLRDGTTSLEGRVEICYNNVWGAVCENSWSTNDAIVTCRQLGFSGIYCKKLCRNFR